MLLRELDRQARLEGGAVYMLNGNHESLNVAGDFRCSFHTLLLLAVTGWGFSEAFVRACDEAKGGVPACQLQCKLQACFENMHGERCFSLCVFSLAA